MIMIDIDMPKNCPQCPLLHHGEYGAFEKSWCNLDGKIVISNKRRPSKCPIEDVSEEYGDQETGWWINGKCPRCEYRSMLGLCLEHFCPKCGLKMEYKRRRINYDERIKAESEKSDDIEAMLEHLWNATEEDHRKYKEE